MLNNIIFNNASNENMRSIEQVNYEIENIKLNITELQADINSFEYSLSESEFDDYLDEEGEQHTSVGSFYPSDILKSCDPVAYRCAKSDYEGNFDLDDCTEYTDMVEELDSLESDLESLQDELNSLESEAE